jgi:hypothetical protein
LHAVQHVDSADGWAQGAAKRTGTSDTTIKKLVDAGALPKKQVVPWAPWEIQRTDLDLPEVRAAIEHLKRTGRLVIRDTSEKQTRFFQ